MDFTVFTETPCPVCHKKELWGAGGHFGGRITMAKIKCQDCGVTFMIVPMAKEYQYGITATTEEERKEEAIEKLRKETQLELAERITAIRNSKL